jgi:hypothetical protein
MFPSPFSCSCMFSSSPLMSLHVFPLTFHMFLHAFPSHVPDALPLSCSCMFLCLFPAPLCHIPYTTPHPYPCSRILSSLLSCSWMVFSLIMFPHALFPSHVPVPPLSSNVPACSPVSSNVPACSPPPSYVPINMFSSPVSCSFMFSSSPLMHLHVSPHVQQMFLHVLPSHVPALSLSHVPACFLSVPAPPLPCSYTAPPPIHVPARSPPLMFLNASLFHVTGCSLSPSGSSMLPLFHS